LLFVLCGCIENHLHGKEPVETTPSSTPPTTTPQPTGPSGDTGASGSTADSASPTLPGDATTVGTAFLVAFGKNLPDGQNGPTDLQFDVTGAPGVSGAVEVVSTGLRLPFLTDADGHARVSLGSARHFAEDSEVVHDLGLFVTAEAGVRLVAVHQRAYFSDASTILPLPELGTDYYVSVVPDEDLAYPVGFVVAAAEDDTHVHVEVNQLTWGLHGPGAPMDVTLMRGQTIQFLSQQDLSGSHVTADRPIAVFGGSEGSSLGQSASSHTWEQLPAVHRWGTGFVAAPLSTQDFGRVALVAGTDGTTVDVGGTAVALDAGEHWEGAVDRPTLIRADRPILAAQYVVGDAAFRGDPNLVVLTPAGLTQLRTTWSTDAHWVEEFPGAATHFVTVWSDPAAELVLDGVSVTDPGVAIGTSALWHLPVGEGTHELVADHPFSGMLYGLADYNAWSAAIGYDCSACSP
jgi:hypothetical protein